MNKQKADYIEILELNIRNLESVTEFGFYQRGICAGMAEAGWLLNILSFEEYSAYKKQIIEKMNSSNASEAVKLTA